MSNPGGIRETLGNRFKQLWERVAGGNPVGSDAGSFGPVKLPAAQTRTAQEIPLSGIVDGSVPETVESRQAALAAAAREARSRPGFKGVFDGEAPATGTHGGERPAPSAAPAITAQNYNLATGVTAPEGGASFTPLRASVRRL